MEPFNVVFLLAILFLASYVVGGIVNRIRVTSTSSKVLSTLASLGSEVRRAGVATSGAVLTGKSLYQIAEYSVVVAVVSLTNPIAWFSSKLAGRADIAILRGKLAEQPTLEVTVVRKKSPAERHARQWGGKFHDAGDFFVVSENGQLKESSLRRLLEPIKKSPDLVLLSLRRRLPHLQVYIVLARDQHRLEETLYALRETLAVLESL